MINKRIFYIIKKLVVNKNDIELTRVRYELSLEPFLRFVQLFQSPFFIVQLELFNEKITNEPLF